MILYGIPNCDTVKKARAWLAQHGETPRFVDFKKEPPSLHLLRTWLARVPAEQLLNRAGTTWRGLDAAQKARAEHPEDFLTLLIDHPSLIKRPVVEWGDGRVSVGFSEARFQTLLSGGQG